VLISDILTSVAIIHYDGASKPQYYVFCAPPGSTGNVAHYLGRASTQPWLPNCTHKNLSKVRFHIGRPGLPRSVRVARWGYLAAQQAWQKLTKLARPKKHSSSEPYLPLNY
jgi:hypothetical protein